MLKGFSGYLQTDGYSAYYDVESVTRVGCWAHARRKWVDCFEGKKPVEGSQSEKAFAYAEKIFALEACWRDMSPDERQKHRMAEMKPVMDAYWNFLSVGVPAIREAPVQYRGTENLGPMWPEAYRSASLPDGAFFSGSVWTFSPCSRMVCKIEGFF